MPQHKVSPSPTPAPSTAPDFGVASVEWQPVLPDQEVEAAPPPDPNAWQQLTFNPGTGLWETSWAAPVLVLEKEGFLYVRASNGGGKATLFISDFGVEPNGTEFVLKRPTGERLRGMVTIEPIGTTLPNRIGIEFRGDNLQPGGVYSLTVSGQGIWIPLKSVADANGRGEVIHEEDTVASDEFALTLVVGGPGFSQQVQ